MDTVDAADLPSVDRFTRAMFKSTTHEDLSSALAIFARWAGFRWYAVHDANGYRPSSACFSEPMRLTNYPPELWRHYDESGFARHDPIIRALECSAQAIHWGEIPALLSLTRAQEGVLSSAFRAGIGTGLSIAVRVPGGRQGVVTLISDRPVKIASRHKATIGFVAPIAFEAAKRTGGAQVLRDVVPDLRVSPRQLECLILVGRGKSDWEAGQILGLSEETVHRHVECVRVKLGVRRRTQLVAKALHLGLIGYGDVL